MSDPFDVLSTELARLASHENLDPSQAEALFRAEAELLVAKAMDKLWLRQCG